jgi:Dual specificity phosphatase, catalytic domain
MFRTGQKGPGPLSSKSHHLYSNIQCGVSCTATLVIALVMKKHGLGTHKAYTYVKERSPWIGPNMSLIYQLTDYGRLCGHERPSKPTKLTTPQTAPLENLESRRYKNSPIDVSAPPSHLSRLPMAQLQNEGQRNLDVQVDLVDETMSSPRFVVSEETHAKGV